MKESLLPHWIRSRLTSGELPWERAIRCTVGAFLDQYSLHDGSWLGLWMPMFQTHSLAIAELDTVWSQPRISGQAYLLIRFKALPLLISTPLSGDFVGPTLAGAESMALTATEIEQLLSIALAAQALDDVDRDGLAQSSLHRTRFDTILGERITVIHPASVEILCLDFEGNVVAIPDVRDVPGV